VTPDVTVHVSFGGAVSAATAQEGVAAGVATASSESAPPPLPLEQLQSTIGSSGEAPAPRSPEELAIVSATELKEGPPPPMPLEQLQTTAAATAVPEPQSLDALGALRGAGAGPPAPQDLTQLGAAGEGLPEPMAPEQLGEPASEAPETRGRRARE
jgi:hypothetical protein